MKDLNVKNPVPFLSIKAKLEAAWLKITGILRWEMTSFKALYLPIEIILILGWSIFAGHWMLNDNPDLWINGYEFPADLSNNYFWSNLKNCGVCALWNGMKDGGYPALAAPENATLNPIIALPGLIFNPISAAKFSVLLSLVIVGFSQWWLGRLLGFGRAERTWAALLAVVSGAVAGRLDIGRPSYVAAIASAWLVIPAGIYFYKWKSFRAIAILATTLAFTLTANQSFGVVGIGLSILPALLFLYMLSVEESRTLLYGLLKACGIALMLSALIISPTIHSRAQFNLNYDPSLTFVQPLKYVVLNLIIRQPEFYTNNLLQKHEIPHLYINYIGWVPVLLALLPLRLARREQKSILYFFLVALALVFLLSSMILPKWLADFFKQDALLSIYQPEMIAGLATPILLGLAAWGLNLALNSGPMLRLDWESGSVKSVRVTWILLAIPLIWALLSAFQFSANYIKTTIKPPDLIPVIDQVKMGPTQWIAFPSGELFWWPDLFANLQAKVINGHNPWQFSHLSIPTAQIIVDRSEIDSEQFDMINSIQGMNIARNKTSIYAGIISENGAVTPCASGANGGFITVVCQNNEPATLTVYEHNWSGWTVRVDGMRAQLEPGEWLAVRVPTGKHIINFTYMPWDVPLGLMISMVGIGLVIGLWRKNASN